MTIVSPSKSINKYFIVQCIGLAILFTSVILLFINHIDYSIMITLLVKIRCQPFRLRFPLYSIQNPRIKFIASSDSSDSKPTHIELTNTKKSYQKRPCFSEQKCFHQCTLHFVVAQIRVKLSLCTQALAIDVCQLQRKLFN